MSRTSDATRRTLVACAFYSLAVGAYLGSGRWVVGRSAPIPTLALDELIPFEPGFALLYLAYFPYMGWLLFTLVRRSDGLRICAAAAVVVGVSVLCFLSFPTHIERTVPTAGGVWSDWVRAIQSVDPSTNALPSLHASLTVLGSVCAWRRGVLPVWAGVGATVAILYAALALKQHLVLDIGTGALLGGAAALCVEWRRAAAAVPSALASRAH